MNRAETVHKSKENWERRPADFYATPAEATWALVDWMIDNDIIKRGCRGVLEPCCGDGAISEALKQEYGFEVTSHDLYDRGYGISGVDYRVKPEGSRSHYEFNAVITNPPFSLADAFIYRAMKDAPVVAMLLPSDFWHAAGRRRFFYSRPPRAVLALTWRLVFAEERGNSPLSNMSWTVWDSPRKAARTEYVLLSKPKT